MRAARRAPWPALASALASAVLLVSCMPAHARQAPVPTGSSAATAALATLPVKGRAPLTGYSRDQFGQAWADVDRDGCDQRNEVLARDLTGVTFKPGTRQCAVESGQLADPYTGQSIAYRRGQRSPIQVDHVVALADAWQTGAQQLDPSTRQEFANDLANLLAVAASANGAKSDSDAASWLPPSRDYRCAYVARQIAVKTSYRLWVTPAERAAMSTVLSSCPAEPLPGARP